MTPSPEIPGLSPAAGYDPKGDLKTPHDRLAEKMTQCPICDSALEKGYITSQNSMEWREQIIQRTPGDTLTKRAMAGRGFNLPSYRCTSCGFIGSLVRK